MDHSKHPRLRPEEMTEDTLKGADVHGPDDSKVGSISHMHGMGPQASAVIDVGGFLGIGAKPVAIDLSRLDVMRDEDGTVHAVTMMSKDELKALPEQTH